MQKRVLVTRGLILATALGLGFVLGRGSSTGDGAKEDGGDGKRPARVSDRMSGRNSGKPATVLAGGGGPVTTADGLRALFKNTGSNHQQGKVDAGAALAGMNSKQLASLVADLAESEANSPGYSYAMEISTAVTRWAELDPDAALRFVLSNRQASFRQHAIGGIFATLASNDPADARSRIASLEEPSIRKAAENAALAAIAVSHPDEWLAWVKASPSRLNEWSIASYVSEWAMDDPVATAARLKEWPVGDQQGYAIDSLAKIWAGKDSGAAMAWANSLENPAQRSRAVASVLGGLAAKDPDAAFAGLASLPEKDRKTGIQSIFQTLADQNLDVALEKAGALTEPDDLLSAFRSLISGSRYGGEIDPSKLQGLVDKLPAGGERTELLQNMGSLARTYSPAELDAMLQGYSEADRGIIRASVIRNIAYEDPKRALELMKQQPDSAHNREFFSEISYSLARQDPQAAIEFALSRKSPQEQMQGIQPAMGRLAATDPTAAVNAFNELPAGPVRNSALQSLCSGWAQQDPQAASEWAMQLDGKEKITALGNIVPALAHKDGAQAAKLYESLVANASQDQQNQLSGMIYSVAQGWAQQDPLAAIAWSSDLSDRNARNQALSSSVSQWYEKQPEAVEQWLGTQPNGDVRDAGIGAVLNNYRRSDPEAAFKLATTTTNESTRLNQLVNVVYNWKESDPDAARRMVESAQLTDRERQSLMSAFR